MAWQPLLKARWATLAPRERRALALAAVVVCMALAWTVLIAPALRTLKNAPAQSAALGAAMERMQTLQARALALRAQPVAAPQDALQSLQSAAAALGKSANLSVEGEQATLALRQISAPDLATWLAAQSAAGVSPAEAHLQRDPGSAASTWSGTLLFRLPSSTGSAQ